MNLKRKTAIIALSLICSLAACFAVIGCKKTDDKEFKAEFKSGVKTESYVSACIDLDDYVKKVDGTEYSVTVSYYNLISGKVVSEVFGGNNMVFYPKTVGEHSVRYEVARGRKTKFAEMKISVISDPPTIIISHTAQTIDMPEEGEVTRSYDYLASNAQMTLLPMTAATKITGVSFRSVSVGLDSVQAQWEKAETEENAESFTFRKIGEYQFFVRAISENNYAEDYFLVNVIKDPSEGNSASDGTEVIKTAKGVVFSENDPYTFKIMSSTISDVNYAVVADKLGNGKKLSLVFKGKNAPQLAFFVEPDESSDNPYNLKTTKGGFFSFVARESSGHKWVFFFPEMLNGNAAKTPVPKFNDFGPADFDNDGYYLMQYSLTDTNEWVENKTRYGWRYLVNVEIYKVLSYSTENEKSSCVIGEKLYEIGAEGEVYYSGENKAKFDFDKGYSVIYGDIRNNIDVQYISDERNILPAPKEETKAEQFENVYAYKATVAAKENGGIAATLLKGKISDDKDSGVSDTLGYIGVENSGFGMGATVSVDFKGKNLPGIGLYLDNSPKDYVVGGATASGTGFYIGNGNVSREFGSIGRRIIVNGPDRLDPGGVYRGNNGYPPYFGRIDGLSYFGQAPKESSDFNKSAKAGYDLLEEGKSYRFEISDLSAEKDPTFKTLAFKYALYDMSDGTPVLIEEATKSVPRNYDTVNFKSQKIAFFGSIHQNIEFSFSVFGDITEYPYETEYDPDAITLSAAEINEIKEGGVLTGFSGKYSYSGLGSYKVGDVLEFRFKGKNIPNVALFANKNGVNPIGGGTENTGIFIQTSGHGTETFVKRTYITGPFLLDAGSQEAYRTLPGLENYAYKPELGKNMELGVDISGVGKTSPFAINELETDKKYIFRISTEEGSGDGKVVIKATLYTTDGKTEEEVASFSKEIVHRLSSLEGRYAVVYGAGDFYGKQISFSYNVKKA